MIWWKMSVAKVPSLLVPALAFVSKDAAAIIQNGEHVHIKANMGCRSHQTGDVVPVLEAYIKGQRICRVYVDGGAQVCVISKKTMHQLGLKV